MMMIFNILCLDILFSPNIWGKRPVAGTSIYFHPQERIFNVLNSI